MTERIDQLIASKDELDPALIASLDDADRADALARAVNPADPNRIRALGILAESDPTPAGVLVQAVGLLAGGIGGDPFVSAAAISLAGMLDETAVPLVQNAATSDDPLVAIAAWRTLQQIARGESLPELEQLAPQPGDAVGDQARFALTVIACRAGIAGHELPVPNDLHVRVIPNEVEMLFSINATQPSDEDFDLLARVTTGELHGLRPTREGTIAIDCGDDHMLLCLDADVQAAIPDTLLQAPALAGVIAMLDPLGASYSTRYLILTFPDGVDGVHVGLFQPDGTQAYWGHPDGEQVAGGELTFPLFALDAPGLTAIALELVVSSAGVTFSGERIAMTEILEDRLEPDVG